MPESVSARMRRLLGVDLEELAGSFAVVEIPLTEALVNRLAAERLARSAGPVSEARIEVGDGDRLALRLLLRGPRLLPAVTIAAEVEQQPVFPSPGVLTLRWSMPGMGPLARMAGPALSLFSALPSGIRVEGDRVEVDVPAMLRARGLGDLVRCIAAARVHTRHGAIMVRLELGVPARG